MLLGTTALGWLWMARSANACDAAAVAPNKIGLVVMVVGGIAGAVVGGGLGLAIGGVAVAIGAGVAIYGTNSPTLNAVQDAIHNF